MRAVTGAVVAPATVVGAALGLVACASPYPGSTVAQQAQSWARATGFASAVSTLEDDAQRVRAEGATADTGGLRTVCDVLVTDALRANGDLPAPDDQLSSILTAAYRAAVTAGRGCLHGAGAPRGLGPRVTSDLADAQSGYVKAQARLDLLELPGGGGP